MSEQTLMYVPAGVHEIHCGLAGIASAVVHIRVDEMTAPVLQASLAAINAENAPQRAFFDFEHQGREAMAWPVSFEWGNNPRGVYARAEMTSKGDDYVKGKVVRSFSGAFYTDADLPKRKDVQRGKTYVIQAWKRGSAENPARITDLEFPAAGSLTNNPAFRANLPLWASEARLGSEVRSPRPPIKFRWDGSKFRLVWPEPQARSVAQACALRLHSERNREKLSIKGSYRVIEDWREEGRAQRMELSQNERKLHQFKTS